MTLWVLGASLPASGFVNTIDRAASPSSLGRKRSEMHDLTRFLLVHVGLSMWKMVSIRPEHAT